MSQLHGGQGAPAHRAPLQRAWQAGHPLTLTLPALRLRRRWQLLMGMERSFHQQRGMGMQQEGESDELKRVFLEGNPYLLVRARMGVHDGR